ncbi:hypothetical protein D3C87_1730630 [compost metagenome]
MGRLISSAGTGFILISMALITISPSLISSSRIIPGKPVYISGPPDTGRSFANHAVIFWSLMVSCVTAIIHIRPATSLILFITFQLGAFSESSTTYVLPSMPITSVLVSFSKFR